MLTLGGCSEVAELLECRKQQVYALRSNHPEFPEPLVTLAATPVWDMCKVQEFKKQWKRRNDNRSSKC